MCFFLPVRCAAPNLQPPTTQYISILRESSHPRLARLARLAAFFSDRINAKSDKHIKFPNNNS